MDEPIVPAQRHKPAPKGRIKGKPTTSSTIQALTPEVLPMPQGHPLSEASDRPMRHNVPCKAHSKQTGKPCRYPAIPGGTVCRYHGGKAPQVEASALERLFRLQHPAVSTLARLMEMVESYPSTGYAAARDVLDRTIGKAAEVVRQEHSGQITIVHELDHDK